MTQQSPHRLTKQQARQIALRAQLLEADRPSDLVAMVRQLSLLQIDPTAAIAPSADLVCWSRLGNSYRPDQLTSALEDDRTLTELVAFIRPTDELGAYLVLSAMYESTQHWLDANARFRVDVLDRLEAQGPLLSKQIPDTSQVPWGSAGWNNNRNVTRMLEMLVLLGEVAVTGRQGRQRVFDLASLVYPQGTTPLPPEKAAQRRNDLRLRAMGIARAKYGVMPGEPVDVGDAGEPAVVEGVAGEWRVHPGMVESLAENAFAPRTALLSPFDRLIHDRVRAAEFFDFEYILEMYKPQAKRRWGYYALPILYGDRLVGKLDATVDRKARTLTVNAVHEDVKFTRAIRTGVDAEIDALAQWTGGRVVR